MLSGQPAVNECETLQIKTDLEKPGTEDHRILTNGSQFTIISSSSSEPQTDVATYSIQVELEKHQTPFLPQINPGNAVSHVPDF